MDCENLVEEVQKYEILYCSTLKSLLAYRPI